MGTASHLSNRNLVVLFIASTVSHLIHSSAKKTYENKKIDMKIRKKRFSGKLFVQYY